MATMTCSTDDFPLHAECGSRLSIYAGNVHCDKCGNCPITPGRELESENVIDCLPVLIEEGIVDPMDFTGMKSKTI